MAILGSCFTTFLILSNKQQLASVSPRPSTSSQPQFTAWLHRGISKPSTTSNHHRLLYSSCRVTPGRALVGADLGLHHPGNPRAYTPSGQLQNTLESEHPTPAQLTLHGGQRFVVSGHSQSLHLTGLGKSLPTAIKALLQEEGVPSPHKGSTSSTQLG